VEGNHRGLDKHTPKGSAIAIGLTDFVANNWAAYYAYLARRDVSYSSHGLYPDDDAFLPDLVTGIVRDVKGRYFQDSRPFFKAGRADYYLLAGPENLNREIVEPTVIGKAVWENDTVRLVKAREAATSCSPAAGSIASSTWKGNACHGGIPTDSGGRVKAARSCTSIPNTRASPQDQLRGGGGLWAATGCAHARALPQRQEIRRASGLRRGARAVRALLPDAGMNKITIRIKEKTNVMRNRWFSLWNPDIPAEWRLLNMSFAQVRLVPHGPAMPVGSDVDWKSVLENSVTFNGFNIDGWLRNAAEFAVANPPGTTRLRIKFQIPGTPDYSFPYSIRFVVNGNSFVREFKKPGENSAEFPLAEVDGGRVEVRIEPGGFKYTAAAFGGRDLIQSIHLDAIAFER
jgi:hypothetical protein